MSSTVTIDERQLLHTVHEYLEKTGQAECLVALENSSKDELKSKTPADLSFLRKLCLSGCWEDVIECIETFQSSEGCKRCLYEATKQWYLETLSVKDARRSEHAKVKLLADLLLKLKELCPSDDDYTTLLSLLEKPSIASSPEYVTWSQGQSRMRVFHAVATWMSKTLYPNTQTLIEPGSIDTRLVRLVAKGLMYERCEQICMSRCGDASGEGSVMLDLSGWMQQQPDSAYQTSPPTCRLAFNSPPSEQATSQQPAQEQIVEESHTKATAGPSEDAAGAAIPTIPSEVDNEKQPSIPTHTSGSTMAAPLPKEAFTPDPPSSKETEPAVLSQAVAASGSQSQTHSATKTAESAPSTPEHKAEPEAEVPQVVATPIKTSNIQVREADSTHKIKVLEEFEDNFTVYTPLTNQGLPSLKSGRDSSTPKPSSNKPVHPSPPTSPVGTPQRPPADTPDGRGLLRDKGEIEKETLPRRRFDFNETTTEDVSIEWPSSTLLCQVQDTQAVRSVAFSQSGSVVAIGANSRTLRLSYTAPLLEGTVSKELPVFYHHSSYHKGSIYCLAWRGDALLASGSNDHKIRLLSYNPSSTDTPCKASGELNVHTGTIRDLTFTPGGLLISGGAVDMGVKVSDCDTRQLISSLSGHTEQVLAVDAVDDNVILSGSQDKTIKLWDLRKQGPVYTITNEYAVNSLSICPLRNEVVSSHSDGSCSVHCMSTCKTRASYHPHSDDCRSVQWSPNNAQWILSGSYDGTVCVTEPASLEWQQIGEHSDKVVQVRWHPDGNVFASTGADKKACFWTLS